MVIGELNYYRRSTVKKQRGVLSYHWGGAFITFMLLTVSVPVWGGERVVHPELSEQEMLTACAECHREATPEVEKEWFDSVHGIAMIKCYQCHGTFESFTVTPSRENCAVCHANMLDKCSDKKPCWECHIPHSFKEKK